MKYKVLDVARVRNAIKTSLSVVCLIASASVSAAMLVAAYHLFFTLGSWWCLLGAAFTICACVILYTCCMVLEDLCGIMTELCFFVKKLAEV